MRRGSSVQGRGVIGGVQESLIGVGGEPFGLHREQGGCAGFYNKERLHALVTCSPGSGEREEGPGFTRTI